MFLLAAILLQAGCTRCGSYKLSSTDGDIDGAYEQCGALSGTFIEAQGSTLLMALVPTAPDAEVDAALVTADPELLVTIPAASLQAGTTWTADQLYGTASAWVAAQGQRQVADLASGELQVRAAQGSNLVGEERWLLHWSFDFQGASLQVQAEGTDKVDIVTDAESAGF